MVKILLTIGSNPEENVQKSQTLLSLMAQYRENTYKDKGKGAQEEAEYVKGRFRILFKLLGQLQELQQSGDLQDLASELCVLEKKMTKENVSGVGGRFEWVDSQFVRALQSGDWLLIDNVNFCSPSVLDRLNALLEPNGVLSINERGVLDGEVPTIVPHPDFRLILAMDPKHGEISRAMRNRGVEIYILGEEEGVCYDDHDIKTMLHGLGLVGRVPCDTLMSIHMEIKENTSSFDRPSILSVLQAASLTVQNMERGVDLQGSLLLACTDVYVRCQKNFEDRQRARDLISAHVIALDMLKIEQREQRSALLEAG
ncbi:midasin-like, partial [Lingula anatina]|uniref:Midasin-like n=1 Tax=Lingula anatina TaxID=7574 RepID=A0A2R2MKN6_LINAN